MAGVHGGHHAEEYFLGSASASPQKIAIEAVRLLEPRDDVKFYVEPAIIENNADVTIHWKGIDSAVSGNDIVTVSCGPVQGPLDYLDLVNVTKVASGSISLPQSLVNMRCDYVFTYLSMNDGVGKSIASFTVKVKGGKMRQRKVTLHTQKTTAICGSHLSAVRRRFHW